MPTSDKWKSTKEYVIGIDGEQIPVTEDVYYAYKRPVWAEHRRKEREKRCSISDGKGGIKRCNRDCRSCSEERTGSVLSLDWFSLKGYEARDDVDVAELIAEKLLLEELMIALKELDVDDMALIDALFFNERTERDYAKEMGVTHQGMNRRKKRVIEKLRKLMNVKDFNS